jgi:peptidoglycan/LPS O-acetylase OafA/YrhL
MLQNLIYPTIPITILIEGITLWFWSVRSKPRRVRFLTRLLALTVANILTQFLLIAALTFSPFRYWPTLLTIELLIVLIEAQVLKQTGLSRGPATRLSLLLNLVSFGLGLFLPG